MCFHLSILNNPILQLKSKDSKDLVLLYRRCRTEWSQIAFRSSQRLAKRAYSTISFFQQSFGTKNVSICVNIRLIKFLMKQFYIVGYYFQLIWPFQTTFWLMIRRRRQNNSKINCRYILYFLWSSVPQPLPLKWHMMVAPPAICALVIRLGWGSVCTMDVWILTHSYRLQHKDICHLSFAISRRVAKHWDPWIWENRFFLPMHSRRDMRLKNMFHVHYCIGHFSYPWF